MTDNLEAGSDNVDDMDGYITSHAREAAKFVFGCNYTFVDDDISQLAALAIRALRAGLTDGIHPDTLREIEKRRAVDWGRIPTKSGEGE